MKKMDSPLTRYTDGQINGMRYNDTWRGPLHSGGDSSKNKSGLWELHATGDADLNGRKYVALPAGVKITEATKQKYNLM
jgi:hypothetical protein